MEELNVDCPGCHAHWLVAFCEVANVPVDVGRVESSPERARNVTRGGVRLCYCQRCGLVHNLDYDPNKVSFEPGYEVALHHSSVFRNFLVEVAERLIEKYQLEGRRILDIGCGDGFFLKTLCRLGGCHGIGIDPTVSHEGRIPVGDGTVNLIRDFWSPEHADLIGDFITSQSMFEDIKAPLQFLIDLRSMLDGKSVPLYFEVFNGYRAFENRETWSIHYEQCNYFSLQCMSNLFRLAGFEVTNAEHCYQGDQYLFVEAVPGATNNDELEKRPVPKVIEDFANVHAQHVSNWSRQLLAWKNENQRAMLWGSGGKGVNFLNSVENVDAIQCVVDINPDRQGRYVPGSGHLIVAPEELRDAPPDQVILTNPIYQAEIIGKLKDMGIDCQVQIA